jgi:hypothetical protein
MTFSDHKCKRCGYITNHLVTFKRHLARKNLCKPKISNNNLNNDYLKYNITEKIYNLQLTPNNSKMKNYTSKIPSNHSNNNKYKCDFCNNDYSRKDNLTKHLKTCKTKKKEDKEKGDLIDLVKLLNEKLDKQQNEFKKELEKRDNQIDILIKKTGININNSTITQNIQQNIKLLAYSNTDTSHLTDNDYMKCIQHSNFCIPHLIEKIHFDPEKPENHNIYISNLKNNYAMIYDGIKWTLKDRDDVINIILDEKEYIIEQKLEEWLETGENYPDIMKKFNRYLEKKENDVVLNKIKNEIKLMLFNNRKMIVQNT